MQPHILRGDVGRVQQHGQSRPRLFGVFVEPERARKVSAHPRRIHGSVNHDVRDVDAERGNLALQHLRHRPLRVHCAREGCEGLPPANRRSRCGKEDGAAAAVIQEPLGAGACDEERAQRCELPNLAKRARRCVQETLSNVTADVVHHNFYAPELRRAIKQRLDLLLVASIHRNSHAANASSCKLCLERHELRPRSTPIRAATRVSASSHHQETLVTECTTKSSAYSWSSPDDDCNGRLRGRRGKAGVPRKHSGSRCRSPLSATSLPHVAPKSVA
mmetsp:Transcript_1646/g.6044  ORF Transcript_1646/g.6044 Transcript_1646/m.6044 type:complete len:275 (+) Transcript_1646:104-928(+)